MIRNSVLGTLTFSILLMLGGCNSGGGNSSPAADPGTENTVPVANAGADVSVETGNTVTLAGSGTDADGDALSYLWTIVTMPSGSSAALSDAEIAASTITPDAAGVYTLSLTVNDGTANSDADTMTITATKPNTIPVNTPPVANAGNDQTVTLGAGISLSASASTDADSDPLSYTWSIVSAPSSSSAALSDTAIVNPSITPDLLGTYTISLVVNDGTVDSAADTVLITVNAPNVAPTANAGTDQTTTVSTVVTLDGSGSSDPETATALLNFGWTFNSIPAASSLTSLANAQTIEASFTPDVAGVYVVILVVNDGQDDSPADTATITVTDTNASAQITTALSQTATTISGAVVSYTKESFGGDVAGFFLQAEQQGPAIFVRIDPTVTAPALNTGDVVTLDATAFELFQGRVEVIGIANLTVDGVGYDVTTLTQDVNSLDIVSGLDSYAAELVTTDLLVTSDFTTAGNGFLGANVDTAAVIGNASLLLRIPEQVNTALSLGNGCSLTVSHTPLWRLFSQAQLSAWNVSEISNTNCPAPVVVSAVATSSTQIAVTFDRNIDALTVNASGDQFFIDSGLTVSSASADMNTVVLQTSTQTEAQTYNLTVNTTVQDIYGKPLNASANTASFLGYVLTPTSAGDLAITEMMINPDTISDASGEWLEIYNPTASLFNLRGCIISDLGTDTHTIADDLVIASGDYATLATSVSAGFTMDYVYSGITLGNAGDEVIITCNAVEIDIVEYSASGPSGASRSLNPDSLDATSNDNEANWCAATTFYNGDFGTPNSPNDACP